METDVLIVGSGCAGLYLAINLPREKRVTVITKADCFKSDSYLAQGGICMLKSPQDFDSFFEETLKAGHFENDRKSVEIMINSSPEVLKDLLSYGVEFNRDENLELAYTKEGAHSSNRILFHKDITGKEITSKLLLKAKSLSNITIIENTTLIDIVEENNRCFGGVVKKSDGNIGVIRAEYTVFATGGIGGLYKNSTNFKHLTGDAIAISLKHNIELKDANYVQIHPTTLYTNDKDGRCFLISESVRGEGAKLYGKDMKRFTDELMPRDLLSQEIFRQMEKDGSDFVWEDLRTIPKYELTRHFPNIIEHCKKAGFDVFRECIPVVPAQHYFMGGIKIDYKGKTSMECLYAVGETACNGVHGRNRLASNSLLESLVFAKKAAEDISQDRFEKKETKAFDKIPFEEYNDIKALEKEYARLVREEINRLDNLTNRF